MQHTPDSEPLSTEQKLVEQIFIKSFELNTLITKIESSCSAIQATNHKISHVRDSQVRLERLIDITEAHGLKDSIKTEKDLTTKLQSMAGVIHRTEPQQPYELPNYDNLNLDDATVDNLESLLKEFSARIAAARKTLKSKKAELLSAETRFNGFNGHFENLKADFFRISAEKSKVASGFTAPPANVMQTYILRGPAAAHTLLTDNPDTTSSTSATAIPKKK
ncbi:MAG: hypothetical protein V4490_07790 [Pseudomonadota bacterium]